MARVTGLEPVPWAKSPPRQLLVKRRQLATFPLPLKRRICAGNASRLDSPKWKLRQRTSQKTVKRPMMKT